CSGVQRRTWEGLPPQVRRLWRTVGPVIPGEVALQQRSTLFGRTACTIRARGSHGNHRTVDFEWRCPNRSGRNFNSAPPFPRSNAMQSIIRQLGERVLGVLSGFDRLLFRGFLRCVINPRGLNGYLYGARVPMADFGKHAQQVTGQLVDESLQHARETGREIRYLNDSEISKKDVAAQIAQRDNIDSGLICVLKSVEPCTTLRVRGNRATKKIAIQRERGKCLHL